MTGRARKEVARNTKIRVRDIQAEFRALGDPDIAKHSARFFKTGKGEYGEGDRFLGIRVPVTRKYARRYRSATLRTTLALLKSRYHEERLLAVLMLVDRYERGDAAERAGVFEAYLGNLEFVDNWDLVDSSAHKIVGPQLQDQDSSILYRLAESANLWHRRVAIMSTLHFIRQGDFDDTLRIAALLRDDEHDLIHKAVGWMLREVGNRHRDSEIAFLKDHHGRMPRTMLGYAIEKFPEQERKAWLHGKV